MDRAKILNELRTAKAVIDLHDVPTHQLYEFLKVFEDSVAVLMPEGELITYINERMSLAEGHQYPPVIVQEGA